MIGVVILTHGGLGDSFLEAAQQVVGSQPSIETVSLSDDNDLVAKREELLQAMNRVHGDQGVIILTDMFGGAASNLAMSVLSAPMVEVIAGVNLPMLIKILSVRKNADLAECAIAAQETGRKYINVATQLLEPERKAARG